MKKINSVSYGGIWLLTGAVIGMVLPWILWLIFQKVYWWLCIAGGVIIAAFLVVFAIEMHQDNGKTPFYEKNLSKTVPFDRETQYAVIRASICTGEKVAGFKNRDGSHFTEVMVIRTPDDLERFKQIYKLDEVKTEY